VPDLRRRLWRRARRRGARGVILREGDYRGDRWREITCAHGRGRESSGGRVCVQRRELINTASIVVLCDHCFIIRVSQLLPLFFSPRFSFHSTSSFFLSFPFPSSLLYFLPKSRLPQNQLRLLRRRRSCALEPSAALRRT